MKKIAVLELVHIDKSSAKLELNFFFFWMEA